MAKNNLNESLTADDHALVLEAEAIAKAIRFQAKATALLPYAILSVLVAIAIPAGWSAVSDSDAGNRKEAHSSLDRLASGLLGALVGGGAATVAMGASERRDRRLAKASRPLSLGEPLDLKPVQFQSGEEVLVREPRSLNDPHREILLGMQEELRSPMADDDDDPISQG